jgi:hypothetical protein
MTAKTLLEKLKKLPQKELKKRIVYCDMDINLIRIKPKEIELR